MARALIIGASGGIGQALATEAARRGMDVTALSRSGDRLDITSEASVEATLGALEGTFDLIFVATEHHVDPAPLLAHRRTVLGVEIAEMKNSVGDLAEAGCVVPWRFASRPAFLVFVFLFLAFLLFFFFPFSYY